MRQRIELFEAGLTASDDMEVTNSKCVSRKAFFFAPPFPPSLRLWFGRAAPHALEKATHARFSVIDIAVAEGSVVKWL